MNRIDAFRTPPRLLAPALGLALLGALSAPAAQVSPGAPGATLQRSDVFTLAMPVLDVGDAALVRDDTGVQIRVRLEGQQPGEIYSMWWGLFNYPDLCEVPYACSLMDFNNPAPGLAIGRAGAGIVDSKGVLNISGNTRVGDPMTDYPFVLFQPLFPALSEMTLLDSRHAGVWVFIRSHGPAIPGLVNEALRTFNGACEYAFPLQGHEGQFGLPGPNTCSDRYFAAFRSEDAP